ncbi:MAG: hypothetical protein JW706_01655 [Opitutales bacterium]|nr:hypothetical protein [Opitutales bacterium]
MNAMQKGFRPGIVRFMAYTGFALIASGPSLFAVGSATDDHPVILSSPGNEAAFCGVVSPSGVWLVNQPTVDLAIPVALADDAFCLVFQDRVPTLHHPESGQIVRRVTLEDSHPISVFVESNDPGFGKQLIRLQWVLPAKVDTVTPLLIENGSVVEATRVDCRETGVYETTVPNLRLSGAFRLPEDVTLTVYDGYDKPLPVQRNGESFSVDVHLRYMNNPFSIVVRRGRDVFHRNTFAIRMDNPVSIEPVQIETQPEFIFEDETWIVPSNTLQYRGRVPGLSSGSVFVYVDETAETVEVKDHGFSGEVSLEETIPHQVKVVWQHDGTRHMRYFRVMWDPSRFNAEDNEIEVVPPPLLESDAANGAPAPDETDPSSEPFADADVHSDGKVLDGTMEASQSTDGGNAPDAPPEGDPSIDS